MGSGREPVQEIRGTAPDLAGFLERGQFVSVMARTGNDIMGFVCDWSDVGVLIDARDQGGDVSGYELLPWSSIERISVEG